MEPKDNFKMNIKNIWSMFFILFSIAFYAQKNTINVKGIVTDSNNNPLENVQIIEIFTKKGTTTNKSGTFTLNNIPVDGKLTFSFVGYKSKTIPVKENMKVI